MRSTRVALASGQQAHSASPAADKRRAEDHRHWRGAIPDAVGLFWVSLVAFYFLLPETTRGVFPGFHWDEATELVPWSNLAWSQVHHGHLPLWDPYSALGTPLAFNWQSAPFSITSIVGYFLPVHWAYTSAVVLSAVIAGTGAYVFGRVLGIGVFGAVLAGTIFELSGSFIWLLGWPTSTVAAWFGWLLACVVLVVRGERRVRCIALMALVVAESVYAGQIDMLGVMAFATAIFVFALFAARAVQGGFRAQLKPFADLAIAVVTGLALSAPLLLPGLQLAQHSVHTVNVRSDLVSPEAVLNVVFTAFVPGVCYVGLIGAVMAVVAVILRWRQTEVSALAVMSLVLGGILFIPSGIALLQRLPDAGSIQWGRATIPMCFGLAMLAGVGVDLLARRPYHKLVLRVTFVAFGAAALLLCLLWLLATPAGRASLRTQDFVWTVISAFLGLFLVAALWFGQRRRRAASSADTHRGRRKDNVSSAYLGRAWWAVALLVACETIFLVTAGRPHLVTTFNTRITATDRALASTAGNRIVAFSVNQCVSQPDIPPELNDELAVHELAAYDPMLPQAYFTAWNKFSGSSAVPDEFFKPKTIFCPAVTTADLARLFGVSLVLTPDGSQAPTGSVYAATLGKLDLYRIPGAAVATVNSLGPDGALPKTTARGHPVSATQPQPSAWKIKINQKTPQVLRIRVTNVPGWHATLDGHPLRLEPFAGIMLQARVPAGKHTIVLDYWPRAFSVGIYLAGVTALGLAVALALERRGRRRSLHVVQFGSRSGMNHGDGSARTRPSAPLMLPVEP